MKLLRKVWNDPVGSKVISALVLGFASAGYTWRTAILGAISTLWSFLWAKTPVPNAILVIASLAILACFAAAVIAILASRETSQEIVESYRTDSFEGIKWHWSYGADHGIKSLYPFCPTCDYQILPQEVGGYAAAPRTRFFCDVCKATILELNEPFGVIEGKVERMIHREIRIKIAEASAGGAVRS